jgi:AcrR family transcriptional regulator
MNGTLLRMSELTPHEYAIPRARLTGDERRATILAAARREFARSGYHGASTASIARAAGCSEPMLYKHFAGKQALFTAVLEQVATVIESGFDTVLSEPGDVLAAIRSYLPKIMLDPGYVEMLQLRKLAITIVHEPTVHGLLSALQDRHVTRVREAINEAKRLGHVREDVDPDDVAWAWTGWMLAGCYREALEPGGFAAMLPHVEAYIDSLAPRD